MKPRAIVIGGTALLAALVAFVLYRYGADENGWRAVIRTTARTSAVCIALAFAGIHARQMLILLPISHAMHYAAIIAVAILTTPANAHIGPTTAGGIAIFALMIATAIRPATIGVWLLWIIFVIAFIVRDMSIAVYPAVMAMLFIAAFIRGTAHLRRRRREQTA